MRRSRARRRESDIEGSWLRNGLVCAWVRGVIWLSMLAEGGSGNGRMTGWCQLLLAWPSPLFLTEMRWCWRECSQNLAWAHSKWGWRNGQIQGRGGTEGGRQGLPGSRGRRGDKENDTGIQQKGREIERWWVGGDVRRRVAGGERVGGEAHRANWWHHVRKPISQFLFKFHTISWQNIFCLHVKRTFLIFNHYIVLWC